MWWHVLTFIVGVAVGAFVVSIKVSRLLNKPNLHSDTADREFARRQL